MKAPASKTLGLAVFAAVLPLSALLAGCLSEDSGSEDSIDVFPKPNGPKMIPLETDFRAVYHYTELDTGGRIVQRIPRLTLDVVRQSSDTFGYAFENPERGYLIRYVETLNRDSSGIWIVGTFRDGRRFPDSTPVRWLPQFPEVGRTWMLDPGRSMELLASDAEYLTDIILVGDTVAAPIVQGMQKHEAYLFKETAGDTVSHYFFRKGVGLLGYERSAGGKLISAGSIRSFLSLRP